MSKVVEAQVKEIKKENTCVDKLPPGYFLSPEPSSIMMLLHLGANGIYSLNDFHTSFHLVTRNRY